MLTWHRRSAYGIADMSGLYAVSRTDVLDMATGELVGRYTAWHGADLLALPGAAPGAPGIPSTHGYKPRDTARPAQLLGIRPTAAEAKALCAAHLAAMEQAA